MRFSKYIMTGGVLAFFLVVSVARADTLATVRVLYDLLAGPGSEEKARDFLHIASESWESIAGDSGKSNSREDVVKRLGGI